MSRKLLLYGLIVVCLTLLVFTWMVRSSLCEVRIQQGNTGVVGPGFQTPFSNTFSPSGLMHHALLAAMVIIQLNQPLIHVIRVFPIDISLHGGYLKR